MLQVIRYRHHSLTEIASKGSKEEFGKCWGGKIFLSAKDCKPKEYFVYFEVCNLCAGRKRFRIQPQTISFLFPTN